MSEELKLEDEHTKLEEMIKKGEISIPDALKKQSEIATEVFRSRFREIVVE